MSHIKVNWSISQSSGIKRIDVSDLPVTEEQWEEMNAEERKQIVQEYLDGEPDQPYMVVDYFEEA